MEKIYRCYSRYMIGISHIKNNIVCQDYALNTTRNGVTMAIISDGCGSADHSGEASTLICSVLVDKVTSDFDHLICLNNDELKIEINSFVYQNIKQYALFRHLDIHQLLATYVFTAVKNNVWLLVRCGDGGIITRNIDNEINVYQETKTGYANETVYFHSHSVLNSMFALVDKDSNIISSMCFSDGVEDLIRNEDNSLNGNLLRALQNNGSDDREKVFDFNEDLLTMIRDETDDDCSIGIIALDNQERHLWIEEIEARQMEKDIETSLKDFNEVADNVLKETSIDDINNISNSNEDENTPTLNTEEAKQEEDLNKELSTITETKIDNIVNDLINENKPAELDTNLKENDNHLDIKSLDIEDENKGE